MDAFVEKTTLRVWKTLSKFDVHEMLKETSSLQCTNTINHIAKENLHVTSVRSGW